MPDHHSFIALVHQLRAGDAVAATEFVARYEPFIRRSLRRHLAQRRLQAVADSADLCQSVLGSFLIRLAAGDYVLQSEVDLRKLLMAITRKKFAAFVRHESAGKRDRSRVISWEENHLPPADSKSNPARQIAIRDLMNEISRRLADPERRMLALRQEGYAWDEISEQMQMSSEVLRQRFSRALRRAAIELGLESDDE